MASDAAPPIELVVTSLLSPLGARGTRRRAKDPLPQWIVRRVDGVDVPEVEQDIAVISIHTFAASPEAAIAESDMAHAVMVGLALNPLVEIALPGGRTATVDHCRILRKPAEVDYEDPGVVRYVGRYEIGLPYIS